MSVLESDVIDIIATRPDSREVRLVIADHLTWDDPEHLSLLQAKLNAYLAFYESGRLASTTEPKIPPDPQVGVVIALKHAPTAEAEAFLQSAAEIVRGTGMGLTWKHE